MLKRGWLYTEKQGVFLLALRKVSGKNFAIEY